MKMKILFRLGFILCFLIITILLLVLILKPIFISNNIIFPYSIQKFNICEKNPTIWFNIKLLYIVFYVFASIIISNSIFNLLFKNIKTNKDIPPYEKVDNKLKLFIGYDNNKEIYIKENGLYQNFLISGTTGSGKTSSAMYPFTKQLIAYSTPKIGMLILDVKGNFHKQVKKFCNIYDRENDLIILEIGGKYKYNPLHKPNLSPIVLANRLKTILLLFSENNSDSYWLDKAEQAICEAIKLCRLYNNNYVNFLELHKIITDKEYYTLKISVIKELFHQNKLSEKETYGLLSALNFFEKEFNNLDSRVLSILKSEITRITNLFISDLDILNTFCSKNLEDLNFTGFEDVIKNKKIVVLNMNTAKHQNLSKVIATYLKLDFQDEVLQRIENNDIQTTAFICDEYHEYATINDANFFALSREAKCINIIATQSYTSILNTLKNEYSTKVIIQNLINKLWFRTDDMFTIEEAQKQIGKEDKIKISKNISENSNNINYSILINSLKSDTSGFSESVSTYVQTDYIYDTNYFTKNLKTFEALGFISNGFEIIYSSRISLVPYFK